MQFAVQGDRITGEPIGRVAKLSGDPSQLAVHCLAGKFFWYLFIIFLTLNLMAFYGIMGVYVTPDLVVATVLSSFFYGFWYAPPPTHARTSM